MKQKRFEHSKGLTTPTDSIPVDVNMALYKRVGKKVSLSAYITDLLIRDLGVNLE